MLNKADYNYENAIICTIMAAKLHAIWSVILRTYPPNNLQLIFMFTKHIKNRQLRNSVEQTKPLQSSQDK